MYTTIPQPISPQQALTMGFRPIPLLGKRPVDKNWTTLDYAAHHFRPHNAIGLATGPQPDGTNLNVLDFDHKPENDVDATSNYTAFASRISPELLAKLFIARSTSGTGFHVAFRTASERRKTWLRDGKGHKVGDMLGTGAQWVMPTPDRWLNGTLDTIPLLTGVVWLVPLSRPRNRENT